MNTLAHSNGDLNQGSDALVKQSGISFNLAGEMEVEFVIKGKQKVDTHYVNGYVPYVVEENFQECYPGYADDVIAEVLQDQEILYQSLERNGRIDVVGASPSTSFRGSHEHGKTKGAEGSMKTVSLKSQLGIDEALAKELQQLEDQLADASLSEVIETEAGPSSVSHKINHPNLSSEVPRHDDIDPDNMTYEELQSLTESIGTISRGLTDDLISRLPSSTYKTGFFSRKLEDSECVICYMAYKNRDKIITLPCQHKYHFGCIARWLKINKACPVCNEEVFGS